MKLLLTSTQPAAASGRWPRIESDPAVCDGGARICGTRVPVWVLVEMRRQGANDAEILANYPRLETADLEAAWRYVQANREEIESEIGEHASA
jgi:uncharacterized protein (DUF433 family)